MPKRISKTDFEKVRIRAGGCCEYCKCLSKYAEPFTGDHIIPISKGGTDNLNNIAYTCSSCNFHKYTFTKAIDPDSQEVVVLFNPRKDIWAEHFKWSKDKLKISGKSASGRATILRLKLNRNVLKNLRRILLLTGNIRRNNLFAFKWLRISSAVIRV